MTYDGKVIRRDEALVQFSMLDDSLKPIWQTSRFTYILFDWCHTRLNQHPASVVARHITVYISFASIIFLSIYQALQLDIELFKPNSSIYNVLPNLMWFSSCPVAVVTYVKFILHRSDYLKFFSEWRHLEQQLGIQKAHLEKQLYYIVYGIYLFTALLVTLGAGLLIWDQPEASYLLSYYDVLRNILTLPGALIIHTISGAIGWTLNVMADLVPAWVFYHAGVLLKFMSEEIKGEREPSRIRRNVREIRLHYETVNTLVNKANKMFGFLMAINHVSMLVMICSLMYTILSMMRCPKVDVYGYIAVFIVYIMRLIVCTLMASHLVYSFVELKESLAVTISNETMSHEECNRAVLLLARMKESSMTARPLNLYEITPTTLLTIASLIVSYVIVLLQSN